MFIKLLSTTQNDMIKLERNYENTNPRTVIFSFDAQLIIAVLLVLSPLSPIERLGSSISMSLILNKKRFIIDFS